jgi:hypothetical protein
MTVRALSRASDEDAVILRLENEHEPLRLPRFWETDDGIVDVGALLLEMRPGGTPEDDAARARVLEITAEYGAILAAEAGIDPDEDE